MRGLCCHVVSIRPSDCPSVTFVDHVKTNKHVFEILSPSGSDTILVFPHQRECRYSDECKGYDKMTIFFTNSSLYIRNGYSYMGTCSETICKHRIPFPSIQHLAWLSQGRPQEKQKCGKNSDFWTYALKTWKRRFFTTAVRITGKLLKIDGYMLRAVWQGLNCLSIHAIYCVIIAGASP